MRTLLLRTVRGRRAIPRRWAVITLTATALPVATGGPSSRQALQGGKPSLTSSSRLKAGDSSRGLASRCWFAVHRPGNPVASPRSHVMPCRGLVLGNACAYLIIVDMFDYTTMRREGVAFLAGLRPGLGAAILMAGGRTASGLGTPGDPGGI